MNLIDKYKCVCSELHVPISSLYKMKSLIIKKKQKQKKTYQVTGPKTLYNQLQQMCPCSVSQCQIWLLTRHKRKNKVKKKKGS